MIESNGFLSVSQTLIKFGVCLSREYISAVTPPKTLELSTSQLEVTTLLPL